jgi:hypothetical protein
MMTWKRLPLLVLGLLSTSALATDWIVPGTIWTDTDGNKIDAHGGGVFQQGKTFYWVGQSAANSASPFLAFASL